MKIKKLITINWANLPNQEYLFGNLVFLTGETGVGKSTMLDAIQTVMTGAKKNIVLYNAGQDEAQNKKRDKEYRTVEGYFLGEDRFQFARPDGCVSTIAVVFESSKKEKKNVFTALVSAYSTLEIRNGKNTPTLESMELFILNGVELNLEELKSDEGEVYTHIQLYKQLSDKYKKENVIKCNGKTDYLNTLYGHLWGKGTVNKIFSEKAARAFTNFIHAKPVDNINEFVRREFLEQKEMKGEVEKLSEAIRALDKLEKDAQEVEEAVLALGLVNNNLESLLEEWFENVEQHYKYRVYKVLVQKEKIDKRKKEYEKKEKEQIKLSKNLAILKSDKELNAKSLRELITNSAGNDKIAQLERVEKGIQENENGFKDLKDSFFIAVRELENHRKGLASIFLHREKNLALCEELDSFYEELETFTSDALSIELKIDADDLNLKLERLEEQFTNLSFIYKKVMESESYGIEKEQLTKSYEALVITISEGSSKIKALVSEIENLKNNKAYCPNKILVDYKELKHQLPKANARMLYEFVELKDEAWMEAIEGFLANKRFAVLVDGEYEKEAIELVKKQKSKLKIIQGTKVLKEIAIRGKSVDDDSIVKLLKISDEVIEAYLISSYGNVLCIKTTEELRRAKRGLMIDGKASSNNLMFSCLLKDRKYIFGEKAREETLANLIEEYNSLEEEVNSASTRQGDMNSSLRTLDRLEDGAEHFKSSAMMSLMKCSKNYQDLVYQKSLIDTSDIEKVHNEIDRLNKKDESFDKDIGILNRELGAVEDFIKSKEKILSSFENDLLQKEALVANEAKKINEIYKVYRENNPPIEEYLLKIEESIDTKNELYEPKTTQHITGNLWQNFRSSYKDERLNSSKVHLIYMLSYQELVANVSQFRELFELHSSIEDEVSRLKNSTLFEYKEAIVKAKDDFNEVFINDFCQAIYINIKQGESYIDELNRILKGHQFGNEVYKVKRLKADKELMEYKEYFKTIYESKSAFGDESLFGEVIKEEASEVKKHLFELFMDTEKHLSELTRVSDYRNYANYDIVQFVDGMEISLSRNGKNSGGQGETSYYIIRSLNLQSSLKSKESRGNALETAIMDETFLKLNEKRSKEILSYLTDTLNFQVICAMPTKQVGSFLDMDSTNYHIVQSPLMGSKNGELDYKTFVEFKSFNNIEIKKLVETKQRTLLEEIEREADERYDK